MSIKIDLVWRIAKASVCKKRKRQFNRGTGILTMENSTASKSEYSNIPVKKEKEYILSVLFNRGSGILSMEILLPLEVNVHIPPL